MTAGLQMSPYLGLMQIVINEQGTALDVQALEDGKWSIDNTQHTADLLRIDERSYHMLIEGKSYRVYVELLDPETKELVLIVNGERIALRAKGRYEDLLESLGMSDLLAAKAQDLKAPMPGKVVSVEVATGQSVSEGDALLVLEAMKMENVIKAEADGEVVSVSITAGDTVEKGEVLIVFA